MDRLAPRLAQVAEGGGHDSLGAPRGERAADHGDAVPRTAIRRRRLPDGMLEDRAGGLKILPLRQRRRAQPVERRSAGGGEVRDGLEGGRRRGVLRKFRQRPDRRRMLTPAAHPVGEQPAEHDRLAVARVVGEMPLDMRHRVGEEPPGLRLQGAGKLDPGRGLDHAFEQRLGLGDAGRTRKLVAQDLDGGDQQPGLDLDAVRRGLQGHVHGRPAQFRRPGAVHQRKCRTPVHI